ncbi:MAG: accessory factor UbiK family protein [Granulosicoccus sp.]|nr:accessory factor UbiK family protein [Granulosicoccus sp.]
MVDARVFDEIAASLGKLLPPGAAELRDDFEKNARSAVQSAVGRLDLVTREEFDVQTQVLQRTRAKLEALEARVAALENAQEQ